MKHGINPLSRKTGMCQYYNMIKTRFAPSPTGYLHIGGLRTALYSYLFAKQNRGKFILRIEDTDQSRAVPGAEKQLIEALQKMGLKWHEGPIMDKTPSLAEKGQNGPYFQSKRLKIYQEYVQKLLANGNAYYCFCSTGRLADLREKQQAEKLPSKYDGCCRKLTESEIKTKLETGDPKVIRLKVPENREVVFTDLIRGEVKISSAEIDDQVLIKSDGYPTYHLANVIDDHLMNISHVIRGEEWLPSTPKHILLYEFFGWNVPRFAHLPLLLNKDKSKLSKRQGDVAVEDYLDKGYLPEALLNYVALLGWHPSNNREIFTLKQLVKEFKLERVQKAGAVFDPEKLNWFNCHYISQKKDSELVKLCKKFLPNVDKKLLAKILNVEKERINYLSEIGERAQLFINLSDYDKGELVFKKSNLFNTKKSLQLTLLNLSGLKKWSRDKIKSALSKIVADNHLTNGDVFWPARVAVSGLISSPPPEEIMEVLGKEESLNRLKLAVDKMSELS